MKQTDNMKT